MELVGQKVKLRALQLSDAGALLRNLGNPAVIEWLDHWAWRPYSLEDAQDFIARRLPDSINWAVECLEDGAFLGTTGLHSLDFRNRNCFWGIAIGPPERWGRGYGSEACRLSVAYAFDVLGLEKIYLHVYDGNERGFRAYEKAGFSVEGLLPRHHWHRGGLIGARLMAVYRDHPLYARS